MGGLAREWNGTLNLAPQAGGMISVDVTMTKLFPPDLVIGWEVVVLPPNAPLVQADPGGVDQIGC